MSTYKYDEVEFYKLLYAFGEWEKVIKRKNTSQDLKLMNKRTDRIIEAYNDIISYTIDIFKSTNTDLKEKVKPLIVKTRDRIIKCFEILQKKVTVPRNLTETIVYDRSIEENNAKMAETFTFLSNVSKIISNTYKGDPNGLNAFIASIELANASSTNEQKPHLIKFIKTKLEGKALECLPETVNSVDEIINALKNKIKPNSSKVVLGKFLALRGERNGMSKFQEQAEALADELRRAFISEGMSHALADKTTVEKTVEMCRLSARTNLVKSILASTQFTEPKEVLAKLITESNTENNEAQVLFYRGNMQNRFRGNSNNQYRNNNWRGRQNNQYNSHNNSYRGRNFNSFNQRGRGRNTNRNNNPNNRNFNNNRNQNYRNNENRYVRFMEENQEAPRPQRGEENTVSMSERRM